MRLRLVGDVVFTTPAIHALRRHFPAARIDYLVEPAAAAIVRHDPDLTHVIEVERPRGLRRIGYDLALARRLRATRYDIAIDFHGGPRAAWLVRATGARRRLGYDIPGRRFCYTTRVPWHPDLLPPRHSVLNQWDLLTPLGIAAPAPASDAVRMTPGAAAIGRPRAGSPTPASRPAPRSWSCTSAPATRSGAGPASRSPGSPRHSRPEIRPGAL